MKLCAIYNVWHDWDLLAHSLKNIDPLVEGIIIVASEKSNHGEISPIPDEFKDIVIIREPQFYAPQHSETDKRNYGLNLARKAGYTHFLSIDSDEFYEPEPFLQAKEMFHMKPDLKGLVCDCQTYFKRPQLTIGLDTTLVPFIHEITPTIRHEFNPKYPFAWRGRQIMIDPTRQMNINSGIEKIDLRMHHLSWVRKDFKLKIRNSTARANLERSCILNDLVHAKEGYFVEYYGKTLERSKVNFNIPEIYEPDNSD
jgi:hypothetical protein